MLKFFKNDYIHFQIASGNLLQVLKNLDKLHTSPSYINLQLDYPWIIYPVKFNMTKLFTMYIFSLLNVKFFIYFTS